MSDDEIPDPLAALDQLLRAAQDLANVVRSYFVALVNAGFSEAQALELAAEYQTSIVGLGASQ